MSLVLTRTYVFMYTGGTRNERNDASSYMGQCMLRHCRLEVKRKALFVMQWCLCTVVPCDDIGYLVKCERKKEEERKSEKVFLQEMERMLLLPSAVKI